MANSRRPLFVTTRWSMVLTAADGGDTTGAEEALGHLCRVYWYPLYAFVRRRGHSPPDAQDLTQEFFARLLKGNWLAQADQQRGKFRSFLLSAMKHFLANQWHRDHAQKRGSHRVVSLDENTAEDRFQIEPASTATPERLFERNWALTLLRDVLARLEEEYRREGKQAWMDVMRPALASDRGAVDYAGLARTLGTTENAARVAVHRLRRKYRHLIREEVAATVASPEAIDEEMRHLFEVLARA